MTLPPDILNAYLDRLGVERPPTPSLEALRALHVAHLRAIPFENSSVLFGEPIELDASRHVRKLAVEGRGGFCYELNGAFAELLRTLGFEVDYLSARVYYDAGHLGQPYEHLALRVPLDDTFWLVDVGFGYSFLEPLRLEPGLEQADPMGAFRLVPVTDDDPGSRPALDLEWRHRDGRWVAHYRVDVEPSELADFAPQCAYLQAAPESIFVQGWLCSRLVEGGGVTLFDRAYISSTAETRDERELSVDEIRSVLASAFGIQARHDGNRWVRASS